MPYTSAKNIDDVIESLKQPSVSPFKWLKLNLLKGNANKFHFLTSTDHWRLNVDNFTITNSECEKLLQSFTKYMRLNLVFMWNSALREKFDFLFSRVFGSINKTFILAGRLGTRLLFYEIWTLSWYFLISLVLSCSTAREATRIYRVLK